MSQIKASFGKQFVTLSPILLLASRNNVDQVPRKEFEVEPNVRDRKIYNPTCQRGNEHKGVFFWRGKGDKVRGREKTPLPELGGKGGTFSFTSNRDENAIENVVFQFAQVAFSLEPARL